MDEGSSYVITETVTNLCDGGQGLIHDVGQENIAVDVGNHWNGATEEALIMCEMFSVDLNPSSRAICSACSIECGRRGTRELCQCMKLELSCLPARIQQRKSETDSYGAFGSRHWRTGPHESSDHRGECSSSHYGY